MAIETGKDTRLPELVCCGQPMEAYHGIDSYDMFDFGHELMVDYECLACGKEIFDVPA